MSRLTEKIRHLLKKQSLAVLATQGQVYPYATLVGFAFTQDLKRIIFATSKTTRKYRNVMEHPHVSLLIDSRSNAASDFQDAVALTVMGRVSVMGAARYGSLYLKRFPHLEEFVLSGDTALVAICVHRYIFVRRFQEVQELAMR